MIDLPHPEITKIQGSIVHLWIKKEYPDLYKYVMDNKHELKFSEFLYLIYHDLDTPPVCEVCGKPVTFKGFQKGYPKTCGRECTARHPEYKKKSIETCLKKYGVENVNQSEAIKERTKKTNLQKYGVESTNQVSEIKIKQHQTKQERYGDPNYSNREKIMKTKQERYGDPNYSNREKAKRTCLERYGVEFTGQVQSVKNKSKQTKQERYGDPNYTNREKSKQTTLEHFGVEYGIYINGARNAKSQDSKPNIKFKKILDQLGFQYEREFRLDNFIYDFRVDDILIDINPSITHNSTINIFGGSVKGKYYHWDKTQNAIKNGYKCICIWDWTNPFEIITNLKNINPLYNDEPNLHWYNLKNHTHLIGELSLDDQNNFVQIWDDGLKC